MPGTVYTKPKFDKLNPQVFSTKNVDVELGVGKTRYIDEVLLGGNWQKFALCMTLKKTDVISMLNDFPTTNDIAQYLITNGAKTPSGENLAQVEQHVANAINQFEQENKKIQEQLQSEQQQKQLQEQESKKRIVDSLRMSINEPKKETSEEIFQRVRENIESIMKKHYRDKIKKKQM